MVVGLTGKYCSGKSVVARSLASRGFRVIDVDGLGHEALVRRSREVQSAFGPSVRAADGAIDRKALGRIVFSDRAALARLESIVHPVMVARVKELVAAGAGDVVINAAVLHRMRLHELCDAVVVVTAPLALRVLRGMRRDSLGLRQALARARAQPDILPQSDGIAVDTYTVANRGSARSLDRRVERLARRLRG